MGKRGKSGIPNYLELARYQHLERELLRPGNAEEYVIA